MVVQMSLQDFLRKTKQMEVGKKEYLLATANGLVLKLVRRAKPKRFAANEHLDAVLVIGKQSDLPEEWNQFWGGENTFYDVHEFYILELLEREGGEDFTTRLLGTLFGPKDK